MTGALFVYNCMCTYQPIVVQPFGQFARTPFSFVYKQNHQGEYNIFAWREGLDMAALPTEAGHFLVVINNATSSRGANG